MHSYVDDVTLSCLWSVAMAWCLYFAFIVAVSLQEASAIPLRDFYPYGADQGEEFLGNDDGFTEAINLTLPFPFFGRDYRTIFVSSG